MANICEHCTARYATGLDNCPQCGSPDRHDEHDELTEAAIVATGKPKTRRKPGSEPDDGDPAADGGEAVPTTE